jgi:hypothetical protein
MGFSDMIIPFVFLCLAITLVAQASITIQTYASTSKAKDLNYYWSCFVLAFAIVGLLASGYMLYKAGKPAPSVEGTLSVQAQAILNAQKALEEVKAAGIKTE